MMATDAPDFPDLTVIDEVPSAPLPLVVTPPADRQAKPDIANFRPGELDGTVQPKPLPDFLKPELTDPIAPISPTPYFADPIDRQFHYYGALIDHADAYKAANGRDPEGADLAAIQDRAAAEAFPPGEEPVALRPYAAPASAVTSTSAPVGDGPAMSDTGEGGPVPQEQPTPIPETEAPTSEPPPQATGDQGQQVAETPVAPTTPTPPPASPEPAPQPTPQPGDAPPSNGGVQSPVPNPTIRDDTQGHGGFGDRRDGGRRKHEGVDLQADPGTEVKSPIAGEIDKIGPAYKDPKAYGGGFQAVRIHGDDGRDYIIRYVEPGESNGRPLVRGDKVQSGQVIGHVQDRAAKDPSGQMRNHVHFEVKDEHGRLIDPTPIIGAQRPGRRQGGK